MKQRIYIIEGPDRTGKTHIANRLGEVCGIPVFKRRLKNFNEHALFQVKDAFKHALEYDQTYIVDFLKQTGSSVIFDRGYPSEWVYSKLFHRETNLDVLDLIDQQFADLECHIIICLREWYVYEDKIIKQNEILKADMLYQEFYNWTSCKKMILHTDSEDVNEEINLILRSL